MDTPENKSEEPEKRSLHIELPEQVGLKLTELARQANKTTEEYVSSMLEEAILSGKLYAFLKDRPDSGPALSS